MSGLAPLVCLDNPIRDYAWGSRTAIAQLQGRPDPAPEPEAELWVSAHPTAPSRLPDGTSLDVAIAADPSGWLGSQTVAAHGPTLPFLLKVLAVERSLSLQAHPSAAQAAAGFAREEAAGIPRDAPHRSYRDGNTKPELLCALTPFEALCGFRPIDATLQLLDALPVRGLERVRGLLRREGAGALPDVVRTLLRLDPPAAGRLVQELYEAAGIIVDPPPGGVAVTRARRRRDDSHDDELRRLAALILELASRYPHDPGVAVAMLLNHVTLAPGQAVYLPAGVIHAYLSGMGVEIMANSDNVLRGGLTPKHVDVAELLTVLRTDVDHVPLVTPQGSPPEPVTYPTPTDHFSLARLELDGAATVALMDPTIRVVLGVEGNIEVVADDVTATVTPGGAAAIPARANDVRVGGRGQAFLATPGV